jgi:hypothetical protein
MGSADHISQNPDVKQHGKTAEYQAHSVALKLARGDSSGRLFLSDELAGKERMNVFIAAPCVYGPQSNGLKMKERSARPEDVHRAGVAELAFGLLLEDERVSGT